jgi:predicted PolB exonuclease-like 3'-5' exonuclease
MNPYDTMVQWTGSPRDYVKLDLLAKAFGVPGKQGMDGSKVYQAWKDGQIKEIAEYCRDVDVPMTRNVYQKMVEVLI